MFCTSICIQPFSSSTSCRLSALMRATFSADAALMRAFSMPDFASASSDSSCWICCCACWTIWYLWRDLRLLFAVPRRQATPADRALDALCDFVRPWPVHRLDDLIAGNVHKFWP